MNTPILISRVDLGLPLAVAGNTGALRPRMRPGISVVCVHYTGVSRSYANIDTPLKLSSIVKAINAFRHNEYNYVIALNGLIGEFSGGFQAAHSLGESSTSYGILFLNGTSDPITDAQIASFRWLVAILQAFGSVSANPAIVPHKDMPGAATACPGASILARFPELRVPYQAPPIEPPPAETPRPTDHGQYGLWPLNPDKETVRTGSSGDAVRYLQAVLDRWTVAGNVAVDGKFGGQTDRAVRLFQHAKVLVVDGVVGKQTWAAIDKQSLFG